MVVGTELVPLNPHDLYRASKQIVSMACRHAALVVVLHLSPCCTCRGDTLAVILHLSWCCRAALVVILRHTALVLHWSPYCTGRYAALAN